MKLASGDVELLRAFLKREGKDFTRGAVPAAWVNHRVKRIGEELELLKELPSSITILSLSNMGEMVRELSFRYYNQSGGPIYIYLCPCGQDNHWGSVRHGYDIIYNTEASGG